MSAEIDAEEIERWIQVATETLNKGKDIKTLRASVNGPVSTRPQPASSNISVSASTPSLPVSVLRAAKATPPTKPAEAAVSFQSPAPSQHELDTSKREEDEADTEELNASSASNDAVTVADLERALHPKLWGEASENIFYASDLLSGGEEAPVAGDDREMTVAGGATGLASPAPAPDSPQPPPRAQSKPVNPSARSSAPSSVSAGASALATAALQKLQASYAPLRTLPTGSPSTRYPAESFDARPQTLRVAPAARPSTAAEYAPSHAHVAAPVHHRPWRPTSARASAQPVTPKRSTSVTRMRSSSHQESTDARLMDSKKRSEAKLEELRKERDERELAACTFRPHVNDERSSSRSRSASRPASAPRSSKYEDASTLLSSSVTVPPVPGSYAQQLQLQQQARSRSTGRAPVTPKAPAEDVSVRLQREAERRVQAREEARREHEENEMRNLNFAPEISEKSRNLAAAKHHKPLYERLGELARAKFENQQRLRDEQVARELKTATFAPQLDARSQSLAEAARQRRSVSASRSRSALHAEEEEGRASPPPPAMDIDSHATKRRIAREVAEQMAQAREGCTFAPATNTRSREMVERSALFRQAPSFLERQQTFGELRQMRLEHLARAEDETLACTFRPALAPVTERLSARLRAGETDEERADRLARADAERKRLSHAEAVERHYRQFSFAPDLNATKHVNERVRSRSQSRGRQEAESDDDDSNQQESRSGRSRTRSVSPQRRSSSRKAQLNQQAEMEFRATCTFTPQVSRVSRAIVANMRAASTTSPYPKQAGDESFAFGIGNEAAGFDAAEAQARHLAARIEEWRVQREQRLEEAKRAREADELKECTFEPRRESKALPQQPDRPVIVRGLNRFLELKQIAVQRAAEQKAREDQVFKTNVHLRQPANTFTVPRPFAFEADRAVAAARDQRREERRQREQKEEAEKVKRERAAELRRLASTKGDAGYSASVMQRRQRDGNDSEYTHRPHTRESCNRDLIRRMLEEEDDEVVTAESQNDRQTVNHELLGSSSYASLHRSAADSLYADVYHD